MAKRDERENMPNTRDEQAGGNRSDERIRSGMSDEPRGLAIDEDEDFEDADELDDMDEEDETEGR